MRLILSVFLACSGLSAQMLQGISNAVAAAGGGTPTITPTDSPGAGTYGTTQTVTLSDATGSSTICYTIDGSTPGAATPGTCDSSPTTTYSTGISVAATTTVKAIGTKAAMTNSGVLSSLYTIAGPAFVSAYGAIKTGDPATYASLTTGSGNTLVVSVGSVQTSGCAGTHVFTVTGSDGTNTDTFTQIGSNQSRTYECQA